MTETVTIPFLLTLNPTAQQEQTFKGILGGVRFAYNATLAHVLENWEANKDLPKSNNHIFLLTRLSLLNGLLALKMR